MSQPGCSKVWLITGASSGFGRSMAAFALERGNSVVATAKRTEPLDDLVAKYSSTQLLVVRVDVTKTEDVKAAFSRAKEVFGRIDIVYNNADQLIIGEAESVPIDMARVLFEDNFWGVVNVSLEAVRFFREENPKGMGGTLMQMSSKSVIAAMPAIGFYCASKWAVEGFTETLMAEVNPDWKIKFTIVEPGVHATRLFEHAVTPRTAMHPAYADSPAMLTRAELEPDGPAFQDVDTSTATLYELMQLQVRPLRVPLGKDAFKNVKERCERWQKTYHYYEKHGMAL